MASEVNTDGLVVEVAQDFSIALGNGSNFYGIGVRVPQGLSEYGAVGVGDRPSPHFDTQSGILEHCVQGGVLGPKYRELCRYGGESQGLTAWGPVGGWRGQSPYH